jgi:predicted Zn-dependent protease
MQAVSAGDLRKHLDVFLSAAEDAMRVDDMIGAANNYRLALQISDDPIVRQKLATVDEIAKSRRRERALTRARAAEKEELWADVATQLVIAHEAVPDAEIADRAANALRRSDGDLHRAAALAEYAVSQQPQNAAYHLTLAEVYLAAKLTKRALAESQRALSLAPDDPRAKQLASVLAKKT